MLEKAYKFRLYPTPQQTNSAEYNFGLLHYVINYALTARTQAWYEHQERAGYKQTSATLLRKSVTLLPKFR